MTDSERLNPDPTMIQRLVDDLTSGGVHLDGFCPEEELDGLLLDCRLPFLLEKGVSYGGDVLVVGSIFASAEAEPEQISVRADSWPRGSIVDIDGLICGIKATLIVLYATEGNPIDCSCVYRGEGMVLAKGDTVEDRVRAWCTAILRVGALLDSKRVELEYWGRHIDEVVLWPAGES